MLKLGKAIMKTERPAELFKVSKFDVDKMEWTFPVDMQLFIEDAPFAKGGFRSVFKAKCVGDSNVYVVKYFLKETLDEMESLNRNPSLKTAETQETLARKAVQMHMLAKNSTGLLKCQVKSDSGLKILFGKLFTYNNEC